MLAYFILLWQQCRGVPIHEALCILPLSMRIDGATLLFSHTIKKCKFFGTIGDLTFVRNVCARLRHGVFLPGLFIINEDEYGDSLFIVYKGAVAAYEMNINRGVPRFLKKYEENEVCVHLKEWKSCTATATQTPNHLCSFFHTRRLVKFLPCFLMLRTIKVSPLKIKSSPLVLNIA